MKLTALAAQYRIIDRLIKSKNNPKSNCSWNEFSRRLNEQGLQSG